METMPEPKKQAVIFIRGKTGTGKSYHINTKKVFGETFKKDPKTKWFDGYEGEKVMQIDEIPQNIGYLAQNYKMFLDEYPYQSEFKGGYRKFKVDMTIMISNFTPVQIFSKELPDGQSKRPCDEDLMPIQRRITLYWTVDNPNFDDETHPDYHRFRVW